MFDFKNLIKKYGKVSPYIQTETEGRFDYANGGEWVPGTTEWIAFEGAIVPLSNRDLTYDENGTYTTDDRKLYTYNYCKVGSKIKHKDIVYTIDKRKDYADFDSGLIIYIVVRGDTA